MSVRVHTRGPAVSGEEEVEALRKCVRGLSERVAELEEALRAACADELDALIVTSGDAHGQVYARTADERHYRLIIEQMREGAVVVSQNTGSILYCNRAFATMVQLPLEQVIGRSLAPFIVDSNEVTLPTLLAATDSRADYELLTASGARLPVSISSTCVDTAGAVSTRCLIISNLTDRKDVERLREAQAKLELTNRRKDEFIAMLGHELRNPLAPIRHAAELLVGEEPDKEQLDRTREVIVRQVDHMKRLVDDLLDAGRITRGTLRLRPKVLDLCEVIAPAVESAQRLIRARGHALSVEQPSEPLWVRADPVRITQVITNLLSNAAKYTEYGGKIELLLSRSDDSVRLDVRDNGDGIAGDLLPQIFDAFVQSEASIDRSNGGLGVGLTLVKRVVELHRGSVAATSEGIGLGSTFSVILPAVGAPVRKDHRVSENFTKDAQVGPTCTRVVVCDDNVDAAEMLALVLQRQGHEVHIAYDGEAAIELASAVRPSAVCIDIGLPGIDGYQVATALRERGETRDAKLIALTGYGQVDDEARSLKAGFDHHLVKPVNPADLQALLRAPR